MKNHHGLIGQPSPLKSEDFKVKAGNVSLVSGGIASEMTVTQGTTGGLGIINDSSLNGGGG
jgi:hypothetical protein